MAKSLINKNNPLYLKVRNYIADLIKSGEILSGKKLPPEFELSKRLNVSRSTLRDSLKMLEESGLIIKKHGVGTFVAPQKILECSIQSLFSTTEMIKMMGMKPGSRNKIIEIKIPEKYVQDKLVLSDKEEVVFIRRTRTANDEPVLVTEDFIPKKYLNSIPSKENIGESLSNFFQTNSSLKMEWIKTKIRPEILDKEIAEKLNLPDSSLILKMEHIVLENNGQPIWFAIEFFNHRKFEFTVTRRWRK